MLPHLSPTYSSPLEEEISFDHPFLPSSARLSNLSEGTLKERDWPLVACGAQIGHFERRNKASSCCLVLDDPLAYSPPVLVFVFAFLPL